MEEDDDDFYGVAAAPPAAPKSESAPAAGEDGESGDEPMLESGDEEASSSDSDDDSIDIILDKPEPTQKPTRPPPSESKAIKIEAPPQPTTHTNNQGSKPKPAISQTASPSGAAYPAVRSSTVDVDANPIYSPLDKPITQVDIDADLAEEKKPWRLPGADQSDYFNYGFDEFTWEMYRQRQMSMANNLEQQKAETAQLQSLFGANPGTAGGQGNVSTGPTAVAGPGAAQPNMQMPPGGMPDDMMQMFQGMMSQGIDVSNMDFNTFMGMAQQGGLPGFGGPGAQAGGGFGGGAGAGVGGGGRRGGRGRGW